MQNIHKTGLLASTSIPSLQGRELVIEYRRLAQLAQNLANPRKHTRKQIRQIAASIKSFGFIFPIVVDAENRIVCGHGRYLAATFLGLDEVPTVSVTHLTEPQLRALALADNRLTEIAEWDEQLLAKELKDLSSMNLDFELEVTGFEVPEIDLRIQSLSKDKEDAEREILQLQVKPVSRRGDLWQLDEHRLICGNALEKTVLNRLMGGLQAHMVFADVPYNQPVLGHVSGKGKFKHREFAMASGEMTSPEFIDFLRNIFSAVAEFSHDGSIHFICIDWAHMAELIAAAEDVYSELKGLCVWVKTNAGMGSFYRSQHELVFVYKNGRGRHRNNIQLGRFGRNRTNVWNYPGANSVRLQGEENPLAMHPTVKPLSLVADAILDCSARGEIVLDPCLGSGTTLLAAQQTGRTCYGIEIDPLYVDLTIRRWQKITGQRAQNLTRGTSFDALAADLGGRS